MSRPLHQSDSNRSARPLRFEQLESREMLAGDLELLKDINSGSTLESAPRNFAEVSGMLYFAANLESGGGELWKSDGTEAGTVLVKDFPPSSPFSNPLHLTNVDGTLYFSANDGVSGIELWKSDGTEAGTVLVKDINPKVIETYQFGSNPTRFTAVGSTLYFTANDGTSGVELWKSDGTADGTVRVLDLRYRELGSYPQFLTNVSGVLYFSVLSDSHGWGSQLWKTDGSDIGTVRVKLIQYGPAEPRDSTNFAGTLYFSANDGVTGHELWKSDGTEAGTQLVKDIRVGPTPNFGVFPSEFTNVNGKLYFLANDGVNGSELWKTDGTEIGTVRVKDIKPGVNGSYPRHLTNVSGTLFFRAYSTPYTDASGYELWKSDGTEAGTVRVATVFVGATPVEVGTNANLGKTVVNAGGTLYFRGGDLATGLELWKSDGTEAGTLPIRLPGNIPLKDPTNITSIGDRVFVVGSRVEVGTELFTQVLIDPPVVTGDYNRNGAVDLDDYELWKSTFGSGTSLRADGNGDGVIDSADYLVWRENYKLPVKIASSPPRRGGFIPPPSSTAAAGVATSTATTAPRTVYAPQRRSELLLATPQHAVATPPGPVQRLIAAEQAPTPEDLDDAFATLGEDFGIGMPKSSE